MTLSPEFAQAFSLLHPTAWRKVDALKRKHGRFVHYTTAEAAAKMLLSKQVWMRRTLIMNDFMETEYGLQLLLEAYNRDVGKEFQTTLNEIAPDLATQCAQSFDGWLHIFKRETYMSCISEHDDDEDALGRLSMWRAYGNTSGVAIVCNNTPFVADSDALKAYSSPVAYFTSHQFNDEFREITHNLRKNISLFRALPEGALRGMIFNVYRFAMLSTKHPGFHEEREWRIIYTPSFDKSPHISSSVEILNGIPQHVCKIPLKNIPEEHFFGADPSEIVSRIIVGPTKHPYASYAAFVSILSEIGVSDASKKVVVSEIPLRQ